MKGGVVPKNGISNENAVRNFLSTARFEYKTQGCSGIIFELTSTTSDYISTRSQTPYHTVNSIYMKVVILTKTKEIDDIIVPFGKKKTVWTNEINEFVEETKIQNKLFQKTLDSHLEPICPSLVHSDIFQSDNDVFNFHNLFVHHKTPALVLFCQFLATILGTNPQYCIGIVFLEKLDGYQNMDINDSHEKYMGLYELMRLYEKFHLFHGDPHAGNVLVHRTYSYFHPSSGKATLIDFGRTFDPLNTPEYSEKNKHLQAKLIELQTANNVYEKVELFLELNLEIYNNAGLALQDHNVYDWLKMSARRAQHAILELHKKRLASLTPVPTTTTTTSNKRKRRGGKIALSLLDNAKPAFLQNELNVKPAFLQNESNAKPAFLQNESNAKPAFLQNDESNAKPAFLQKLTKNATKKSHNKTMKSHKTKTIVREMNQQTFIEKSKQFSENVLQNLIQKVEEIKKSKM
jgi:hypothetical protein